LLQRTSLVGFMVALLLGCLPCHAQKAAADGAKPEDILLHGTITPEKLGMHEMLTFTMPPGIQRMDVALESPGFSKGMYLTVGMFDPDRYRGEGRASFTLSTVDATGPYIAGPLVSGTWKIAIGYNWVAPQAHGEYTLRIHLSRQLDPENYPVLNSKAGWYKGDLHAHTGRTDAVCKSQSGANVPCPPYRLFEAAAKQGLDFLAVTDHNTQAHFDEMKQDQVYFDKLLLIAGEEITTVKGHANVWGTEGFLDYRVAETGFTVNDLFDQAHQLHALVSINHAYWPYDGKCPGCGWGWTAQTDFSKVDAIEIINGYHEHGSWFVPPPGNGVPFWEAQFAKGLRPTGVGGGDEHRAGEQLALKDGVGIPTTMVYARELSQPAILEGIKAGHVYIKVTGPEGPELLLRAGDAMMGDAIIAKTGSSQQFVVQAKHVSNAHVTLLIDGKVVDTQTSTTHEEQAVTSTLNWLSDGHRHWIRAELVDKDDKLMALTNPIYVNWAP
jgi:hypothetical protein